MVFSRNKTGANVVDVIHESQPKKIIIVAGPTFGTVMGFLLVGVAIGAAGAMYLKGKASTPEAGEDALYDGLTGDAKSSALAQRTNAVLARVKSLASRARDTIQSASETIGPAVKDAIKEGKDTASQTERDLKKELHDELENN